MRPFSLDRHMRAFQLSNHSYLASPSLPTALKIISTWYSHSAHYLSLLEFLFLYELLLVFLLISALQFDSMYWVKLNQMSGKTVVFEHFAWVSAKRISKITMDPSHILKLIFTVFLMIKIHVKNIYVMIFEHCKLYKHHYIIILKVLHRI